MSNLSREHIDELWRRMTQIFGAQWTSQFGDTDHADTWLRGLQGLSPEDLSRGLQACVDLEPDESGKIWVPSLPLFKSMCKSYSTPAAHEEFKSLPAPELSREQKLSHIAKLREALK